MSPLFPSRWHPITAPATTETKAEPNIPPKTYPVDTSGAHDVPPGISATGAPVEIPVSSPVMDTTLELPRSRPWVETAVYGFHRLASVLC